MPVGVNFFNFEKSEVPALEFIFSKNRVIEFISEEGFIRFFTECGIDSIAWVIGISMPIHEAIGRVVESSCSLDKFFIWEEFFC